MICINCGKKISVPIPNSRHCAECHDQGIGNKLTANLDQNNNFVNDDEYDDEIELPYSFHTPMASRVKLNKN